MRIELNGKDYEAEGPLTIKDLLDRLKIDTNKVVVEHNKTLLDASMYEKSFLVDNDSVEVLMFMGGG